MSDNLLKSQAFKLKGRLHTLTVLELIDSDPLNFTAQLDSVVEQAPKLFAQAPIVLDFSTVDSSKVDLKSLCQIVRDHNMVPVAVQGGSSLLDTLARCQGLAVFTSGSTFDKPLEPSQPTSKNNKNNKENGGIILIIIFYIY